MDEETIEARLAQLKKIENPVSLAGGVALAALYFWWRLEYTHVLAIFTWTVAFAFGAAIPKFYFAVQDTKLGRMRRELAQPPLAEARALGPGESSRPSVRAAVPAGPIQAVPIAFGGEPPKPEPPADPAAGPRFLS